MGAGDGLTLSRPVVGPREFRAIRGWPGGVDAVALRAVLDELITLPAG
jgi:hypothetical protein